MSDTRGAVSVAFAANLAIALAKGTGAFFSGSVGLFAEALHSLVDTLNQVFLFLGIALEARPASPKHPFGHGKERFFWSFVAAIFIFATGAVVSIHEGLAKWHHPAPIESPGWAFAALAFAAVAEALSLAYALRALGKSAGPQGLWRTLVETRDATLAGVVVEEGAALVGVAIAAGGIAGTLATGDGRFDAGASIAVGLLLTGLAFMLGAKSRALLIGQGASPEELEAIQRVFADSSVIEEVVDCYTMQLAPESLLLAAHLQIRRGLSTSEIEDALDAVEQRLAAAVPALSRIFLEAENAETLAERALDGRAF